MSSHYVRFKVRASVQCAILQSSSAGMCVGNTRWLMENVGVMDCYIVLVVWRLEYFGLSSASLSGFFVPQVV